MTQYFQRVRKLADQVTIQEEWRAEMRVKYFPDMDTALMEFTDNDVAETREISENIYLDLDRNGNLVSMTVEHARTNARLPELSYQEVVQRS